MAEFSLQALHDEIEADPLAIGYKNPDGSWKGDQEIADMLNDLANGDTIERHIVEPRELVEQIALGDYVALTAGQQRYLDLVLEGVDTINTRTGETEVRASMLALFGAGTTTRTNFVNVIQRPGSRAEVLWGEGKVVSALEVAYAANL